MRILLTVVRFGTWVKPTSVSTPGRQTLALQHSCFVFLYWLAAVLPPYGRSCCLPANNDLRSEITFVLLQMVSIMLDLLPMSSGIVLIM